MMPRVAIYPGSFDPVTNGHLDVITRALSIVDRVIVAIAFNVNKQGLFPPERRAALLREVLAGEPRVEVETFSGLLVDYVTHRQASTIIRGLRAVADFEYEFQMALMNRRLAPAVDTLFLMTDERFFYVSSSLVREISALGGDVGQFVPPPVQRALEARRGVSPSG